MAFARFLLLCTATWGLLLAGPVGCARHAGNAADAEAEVRANRDAWVPADQVGGWYAKDCAVCHGAALAGATQGPSLLEPELLHGASIPELVTSIAVGYPDKRMPAWAGILSAEQIRGMAIYIRERRANAERGSPQGSTQPLVVPAEAVESEHHAFRLHSVRGGIEHPYSIAPLPDGRILVTEKARGLSIVSADGTTKTLVRGTPPVHTDGTLRGEQFTGSGWVHDVALHPGYAQNGWVYLSHGDRCENCNRESRESGKPVSMIALVRGRIVDGQWTDHQVVWSADREAYQHSHELGTGARIAFDGRGHVFLSLGVMVDYSGIQNLALPYGKVHRVHDDGRVPADNPFSDRPGAVKSTWTLGHRNPQGLDFDPRTGTLWSSEHGPRGGDELNLLLPGRNYGWPMVSLGVDYDGLPVRYAEKFGIAYDPKELTGPVVDWTPSPGVSSIAFYRGEAFPKWNDHLLAATLNGNDLLRLELEADGARHSETLIRGLGRFRDVEVGPQGRVFVLVEHPEGSRILRLDPLR